MMRSTLKQRAYRDIRTKIQNGDLWAGARLSELSLSKELQISRTPIREAIHQLASEGIVEHIPHQGAFVRQLTRPELQELFDLRETLECYAVRRAADHISDADLALLDRLCVVMRLQVKQALQSGAPVITGDEANDWVINDSLFHMLLIRAAKNAWLLKIIGDLQLMTRMFGQRREPLGVSNLVWIYAGHARIVRALHRRDAVGASREMGRHIRRGCRLVLQQCGPGDGATRDDGMPADWPAEVRDLVRRLEAFDASSEPKRSRG
jgi:DNA-binding GntR family transcriptional regulator